MFVQFQKTIFFWIFFIFCVSFFPIHEGKADPVSVGESQSFLVSAYYSPLPGQKSYVWGSYEADLRVNGQGIRSANFTKVYPGMLAGPSSYPFGTKINIPGIGTGTIHDRGGAIIEGKNYDRIDVWMGWGDDGRIRALNWGMREVFGTIMPEETPDKVLFSVLPASAQKNWENISNETPVSLSVGSRGNGVNRLQNFLYDHGYLKVDPTGYYGVKTQQAVFDFQKEYEIVYSWESPGAGVFAPQTQEKAKSLSFSFHDSVVEVASENLNSSSLSLEPKVVTSEKKNSNKKESFEYKKEYAVLEPNLETGDVGDSILRLQLVLRGLGYYSGETSGKYDAKTKEAVFAYQKYHGVVSSKNDLGAGRFGPQTYTHLSTALIEKRKQGNLGIAQDDFITAEQLALRRKEIQLASYAVGYGDRNDQVKQLQEELIARGFLEGGLNTGYYGDKTKKAIGVYQTFLESA